MADKLDPDGVAWFGEDDEMPAGVQYASEQAIFATVRAADELPVASAMAFARWLYNEWVEYDDDTGIQTNGQIIAGALAFWRGQ